MYTLLILNVQDYENRNNNFFCVSVLFCTLKLNSYDAAVIAALVPVVAVICIHTENTRRDLILLLLHTHTRHHHRHHHHCYLT